MGAFVSFLKLKKKNYESRQLIGALLKQLLQRKGQEGYGGKETEGGRWKEGERLIEEGDGGRGDGRREGRRREGGRWCKGDGGIRREEERGRAKESVT